MLPKGTPFHVIDERNSRKVHVDMPHPLDNASVRYIARFRCASHGTISGHRFKLAANRASELCRAEYVRDEGMVIETPYAMGACWFQSICRYQLPYGFEIPEAVSLVQVSYVHLTYG